MDAVQKSPTKVTQFLYRGGLSEVNGNSNMKDDISKNVVFSKECLEHGITVVQAERKWERARLSAEVALFCLFELTLTEHAGLEHVCKLLDISGKGLHPTK